MNKRSDYQIADFHKESKIRQKEKLTDERSQLDDYHRIIYPWIQCFSSTAEKYYFYNPDIKESVWILPHNLQREANSFFHLKSLDVNEMSKKNFQFFFKPETKKEQIGTNNFTNEMEVTLEQQSIDNILDEKENAVIEARNQIEKFDKCPIFIESRANEDVLIEIKNEIKDNPEILVSKELKKEFSEIQSKSFKTDWKTRPAPVQFDPALSQDLAYRERDQDYNIWYDKFIEDEIVLQREGAKTKCNPIIQSGYTKADTFDRSHRNFCIHFARGNCFLGVSCGYYHHIPSLEECLAVDNAKDIFGRSRYATHRKDNQGIGNFMKETRTLRISDFCTPTHLKNAVQGSYEMLWRHFSLWGTIEDLILIPSTNIAFLRYQHRCMAEFAKVAMTDQPLDADEILTIKWTNDDCFNLDEAEAHELEETKFQQRQKQIDIKKKSRNGKLKDNLPNDANLTKEIAEREVNIVKNKLTMDEFYREEELNWNYKRSRDRETELQKNHVMAPFNLFEQKLREGEFGRIKLENLLKVKNQGNGVIPTFGFHNFIKERNPEENK